MTSTGYFLAFFFVAFFAFFAFFVAFFLAAITVVLVRVWLGEDRLGCTEVSTFVRPRE
jgi:hypothetical protein